MTAREYQVGDLVEVKLVRNQRDWLAGKVVGPIRNWGGRERFFYKIKCGDFFAAAPATAIRPAREES